MAGAIFMKKQDLIIIAVLFALLMGWPLLYGRFIEPRVAPKVARQEQLPSSVPISTNQDAGQAGTTFPAQSNAPHEHSAASAAPAQPAEEQQAASNLPEQFAGITNGGLSVKISSRGAGIVSATFPEYRSTVEKDSGPVVLDFTGTPSLAYKDLAGFSANDDFAITCSPTGSILLERAGADGLKLTRSIELNDKYQVIVRDVFTNSGATAQTIKYAVQLGPMRSPPGEYRMSGMDYLGVDALTSSGGDGVIHWAGKLSKFFKSFMKEKGLACLPQSIRKDEETPIDWVAVKNKFFVQILLPEGGAAGYNMAVDRVTVAGEDTNPALCPKNAQIRDVSAAAVIAEKTIAPGQVYCQEYKLYIGPKKYSILHALGLHQEDVMEFGMWSPVCKFLLMVLNLTYRFIPNYGVAIIILTILIRLIFWPLTHKSTQSMKKMQQLQPLMNEIKAKYKDSPRKMQEETMAMYRRHKVNPLSGCLPMLIQIPVFIALFVVLRSAIELRFAPFLWINDLSAPERLFADILPIPLNILPIFMAVTQMWQQSLMPTTDPNQQKMMLFFMPIMMLVMFYMMPSALVLYWSASQCLVIAQQLLQKKSAPLVAHQYK